MIAPMLKFSFVVYHADYSQFLEQLHQLGIVHIETLNEQVSEKAEKLMRQLKKVHEAIAFLSQKQMPDMPIMAETPFTNPAELLQQFEDNGNRLVTLKKQSKELKAQINTLQPWGQVSVSRLELLQKRHVYFHFFDCALHDFDEVWKENYTITEINRLDGKVYFLLISDGETPPALHGAELQHLPPFSLETLQQKLAAVNIGFEEVESAYKHLSGYCAVLNKYADELENELSHENALHNTRQEAQGKLMLLQAWVPEKEKLGLLNFLSQTKTAWIAQKPGKDDKVPILLKNDRFSKLFHPIVKLFSLPAYTEIDLTPFFAPFFMLFFGMCLGDVAYGLLIFGVLTVLKYKKGYEDTRPLLTLGQFLGGAAIIFGLLTGTIAGIDLSKVHIGFLESVKGYFISTNSLFNVSLIIGLVQILFGMGLRVANNLRFRAWPYAMSPLGWMLGIAGAVLLWFTPFTLPAYLLLGIGLGCIVWFSDPDAGILKRIGLGLWDLYGITGLFGDVLSYIRLFALGLSSATLGFVVNTIALSALSLPPVLGEIAFLLILLLGHGLNFGISTLSSFVHPIRLTFVEFYKNAGFTGGGTEFKAFKIINNHHNKQ